MAQPVALFIPDDVASEVAAIAAPSDAKAGVEQLRKLLDTKNYTPVEARIWAAQGWTLAHSCHMAAVGRGDKAGAKASAALEGAFLRLHNDLLGRGFLGRTFGSAKAPFLETLRLAAQRREEQSVVAAVKTAEAVPEVLAQLKRQADAAERSAKAAESSAKAATASAAAAEKTAAAVERLETLLSEGAEQAQATGEAVEAAAKALVALAAAEAAKTEAKAETPAP